MALIAEFYQQRTQSLNLDDFAARHHLSVDDLDGAIRYLTKPRRRGQDPLPPFAQLETRQGSRYLTTEVNCVASWD